MQEVETNMNVLELHISTPFLLRRLLLLDQLVNIETLKCIRRCNGVDNGLIPCQTSILLPRNQHNPIKPFAIRADQTQWLFLDWHARFGQSWNNDIIETVVMC
jgi:hypothetical protein